MTRGIRKSSQFRRKNTSFSSLTNFCFMSDIIPIPDCSELRDRLAKQGLDEETIKKYNLEELKNSYQTLKNFIEDSNNFSDLVNRSNSFGQNKPLYSSSLFIKLEKLILNRINSLCKQKIEDIQKNPDETISVKTFHAALQSLQQVIESQKLLGDSDIRAMSLKQDKEMQEFLMGMKERESKIRLTFLNRFLAKESIATLIGALVIVLIVGVQLSGIFFDKAKTPEILNNTLLIVLGFFFGQSSNKGKGEND